MFNGYLHWKSRVLLIPLQNFLHCQTLCYCCVAQISTQNSHVLTCTVSYFSNLYVQYRACTLQLVKFTYCQRRTLLQHCTDVQRNPKLISYLSTSKWSAGGQHGDILHMRKAFQEQSHRSFSTINQGIFHKLVTHLRNSL